MGGYMTSWTIVAWVIDAGILLQLASGIVRWLDAYPGRGWNGPTYVIFLTILVAALLAGSVALAVAGDADWTPLAVGAEMLAAALVTLISTANRARSGWVVDNVSAPAEY